MGPGPSRSGQKAVSADDGGVSAEGWGPGEGLVRLPRFSKGTYNLGMKVQIQARKTVLSRHLRSLIDRKAAKLQKMLPTFREHDLDLHLHLEQLSKGKQHHTVLVLTMPQTAIRVEEIEANPATSVVRAFDELLRRVKKFKSRLNREKYWQRHVTPTPGVTSPANLGELEEAINNNLDKIENYIRREVYHLNVQQRIPYGIIQPHAVVDQVFLEVSRRIQIRPEQTPFDQWMFAVAREVLQENIAEAEATRDQPHVEETVTEPGGENDRLNFYQPDESLRLEDLLKDNHSDSPEELLQREETEEQIQKAIAELPSPIRESFVLFALEGFNSDEVAMITGKKPDEVRSDVDQARSYLRQSVPG